MPETAAVAHGVNAEVQHETSDVNVRGIIWFGVGLFAVLAVSHVVLVWMFGWFTHLERQQQKPVSKLAREGRLHFPDDLKGIPGPRLQESEEADLARLRQKENDLLNSKAEGRVPIDEALRRMADPKFAAEH